jgi:hypothetical protein
MALNQPPACIIEVPDLPMIPRRLRSAHSGCASSSGASSWTYAGSTAGSGAGSVSGSIASKYRLKRQYV